MIVDTHCHLEFEGYANDLKEVLQRARESGVQRFIIPGADPKTLPEAIRLAESDDDIFFTVGYHPYDAAEYSEDVFRYASHEKCVAIGECGLDYYRLPEGAQAQEEEKALQKEVFVKQIVIAKKMQLPLIVHIREASEDSLEILSSNGADEVGGVLHCYNADAGLLALKESGFYYGIGGVVTFKNAKKLPNILPRIPLESLLLETDSPYLTPHPHRGTRNEPAYTALIAKKVAEILEVSEQEVATQTTKNANNLFFARTKAGS